MKEAGDKLSAADKSAIEAAAASLRKAIESNDAAAINRAMDELTQAQHKAAATLYQQAAATGAEYRRRRGRGQRRERRHRRRRRAGAGGDVIDAEVVDEGKS